MIYMYSKICGPGLPHRESDKLCTNSKISALGLCPRSMALHPVAWFSTKASNAWVVGLFPIMKKKIVTLTSNPSSVVVGDHRDQITHPIFSEYAMSASL